MTAQLLAFNIASYAFLPISVGFFMSITAKRENVKYTGMRLMGLGLVFYGMGIMSDAMVPLRSYEPFYANLLHGKAYGRHSAAARGEEKHLR